MSELFSVNMTDKEAFLAYAKACDGKTKEERAEIFKEYSPVASQILKRDIELGQQGWMIGN